jgi:hypothetical protein
MSLLKADFPLSSFMTVFYHFVSNWRMPSGGYLQLNLRRGESVVTKTLGSRKRCL